MHDFNNLHCVITGGTGALGAAVVGELIGRGATCHVPVYQESELEHFAHANEKNVRTTVGIDLRDEKSAQRFFAAIPGKLWATFNIAGGFAMAGICETSAQDVQDMYAMNAITCFVSCRESVRAMRTSGDGGRIVNVSARPAVQPCGGMLAYQMSKAAVASLTQGLAEEVKGNGILVNAVLPSIMNTPTNRGAMPDADHASWPTVEQVASAMVWLASPGNAVTSGALVPVYGGV